MQPENPDDQMAAFANIETVISDPLRFKAKLGIGGDAYRSMKYGKRLQELWDVGGFAATGAGLATMPTVAGMFFSSGGFLSAIGLGAAAVTPIGWVVAAGVASGGAYYGVVQLFKSFSDERLVVIPAFINTPIDLLGASLFDLMAPLAVKVARIDGDYQSIERLAILDYFVSAWGFDRKYTEAALRVVEENTTDQTIVTLVKVLADFKSANPDCNYSHMTKELVVFLTELAEADGVFDEREEMAIDRVKALLESEGKASFGSVKKMFSKKGRATQTAPAGGKS